MDKDVK